MPLKHPVRIGSTLSRELRPGADIAARMTDDYGATAVATRDLARYYALLERARRSLRGLFAPHELEALAYVLDSMACVEVPELIYLALATVEEAVQEERLCEAAGIEDCEGFLDRVRGLDLAQRYALVDAVGMYLARPPEKRGEEAWRAIGML